MPWLPWLVVNLLDSGWHGKFLLTVDTFRTQVELTGVTFAEDPAHPESWLRDVRLQWWEAEDEVWHDGPMLLSDEALHSHRLQPPLRAARFRLATTGGGSWPAGNIRLGELVLHGRALGGSHRDVLARRGRAVLFDERVEDLRASFQHGHNPAFGFQRGGAFSGGTRLRLSGPGQVHPAYMGSTFGHSVPDWDFAITEHPEPGQYRYFQFAWKAAGPGTTGMSVRIGVAWPTRSVVVSVGDAAWLPDSVLVEHRVPGAGRLDDRAGRPVGPHRRAAAAGDQFQPAQQWRGRAVRPAGAGPYAGRPAVGVSDPELLTRRGPRVGSARCAGPTIL
ncbi:hypothetical protein I5Q34_24960 [Streptomyces sp. AV19]|uniref:hypothetical protein n=1 Tax=Streptomyces sp. AV19 TaxID=2793068 RepID=UPI0018FF0BA6|nr:hypothetical protein [Streptomyces sp. AV19]MBH1937481.1 hypothetical protein [Streptomyces sp. AV19]MDG4533746.1 hypothetical protein [Streptomyces sp. AV19]